MSVFITHSNAENPAGAIYYDHIAAFARPWGEYLALGKAYFRVDCAAPLYLQVYFKPPNKRLIDQFCFINIKCLNSLAEIIETGDVETPAARLNLTDCNALERYASRYPWHVSAPNFERLQFSDFSFFEPPPPPPDPQFYLFDSVKPPPPPPPKNRIIKKIALLDIPQPEILGYNGVFTDKIEADTDLIIYNDYFSISRGNYAPFVVGENINFSQNTIIFRESSFLEFLT